MAWRTRGINPARRRRWSGTPVRLFRGNYFLGGANSIGRTYDVSPDGRRFLMIKPDAASATAIAVVQHWFEEVNRLTRK